MIRRIRPFAAGLSMGVIATSLALLVAALAANQELSASSGQRAGVALVEIAVWAWRNLGYSLPCFVALLVLYSHSLERLRTALAESSPPDTVRQAEHLTDVWTSLFFGVGVIWTAIGMRGALVYALGEPELTLDLGAYAILERMVEGGILLALSTTIFGGIGGYLLRIVKHVVVGKRLARVVAMEDRKSDETLVRIEHSLDDIRSLLRRRETEPDSG